MTNKYERKPRSEKKRALVLEASAVIVLLTMSFSMPSLQSAFAVTDIIDYYGINCGNNYWGNRLYQNSYGGTLITYGTNTSCGNVSTLDGRNNYVEATTENTAKSADDIAWETAFQGVTPWGIHSASTAVNNNTNFNGLKPVQATDYNLDVQYDWVKGGVSVPGSLATPLKVQANILTDVWFKSKDGTKALVIDFGWQHLTNQNGVWVDRIVTDQNTSSSARGVQYYKPFYDTPPGGILTFHYSAVLDTTNRTADTWVAPGSKDIQNYITDAFAYTYRDINGNTPKTTTGSSNYYIYDVESGAEIWAHGDSNLLNYGTIQAGFSKTELDY